MTTLINDLTPDDTELVGSRLARIDPDNFRVQSDAATENENVEENRSDEPVDEAGDPTGEHDHR